MGYGIRSGLVLAVVAGLASAATGQTLTLSWHVSDTGNGDGIVEPGESLLATLYAHMEPGQTGFAGAIFSIAGNDEWQHGTIESYDNKLDSLTDDGQLQPDNSILNIEAFQLPPAFNQDFVADNPIEVYEIVWTPENGVYRYVEWGTRDHLNGDVYTDDFGTSVPYTVVPGSASISIPTPGVLVVLGVAGLGVRRRQR
jgi:MYXO-CTERM domain-containing protein